MTLRQKVIEAGARAMYEADDAYDLPWDEEIDEVKDWYRRMSAIQTDAKLDCLTENREQWMREADVLQIAEGRSSFRLPHQALSLLEVLREDR